MKVYVVHDDEGDIAAVFEELEEANRFAATLADGESYYVEGFRVMPSSRSAGEEDH